MISFALLLAVTAPPPAAAAPVPAAEKIKCKLQPVTGSLAQTIKECHTAAEWEVLRRGTQDEARRMMNSAASSRSN